MAQLLGVHHVSLNTRDVERARRFYVDVLGLTERTDRPDLAFDGAWIDLGPQQIHLIHAAVPDDRGQHFAIRVVDLDAVAAGLSAHGVEVSAPRPSATGRQCFFHDPDGNRIELNEPGPPAER